MAFHKYDVAHTVSAIWQANQEGTNSWTKMQPKKRAQIPNEVRKW
jgi:hypothetical protein